MQGSDASSGRTNNRKMQQQQQQQPQQHSLFSNDCIVLLKRSLEVATAAAAAQQQQHHQQTIASTTTIVYPKSRSNVTPGAAAGGGDDDNYSLSSVENDNDDDSSSSSLASASDGSEKEVGEDDEDETSKTKEEDVKVQDGLKSSDTITPSNSSRNVVPSTIIKKRNKLPAQTMDKRQRDLQVRKHIESLVCTRLPLTISSLQNQEQQQQQQQQQQETTTEQQLELRLASALLPKECRHSADNDNDDNDDQGVVVVRVAQQARYFLSLAENNLPWVVLFLRSGRFSGAIFQSGICIQHRNLQRYTVRKGQGKAQSMQDSSGRRPKSIGAQLRRAGEEALKNDICETLSNWKHEIQRAVVILISCPKTMRKTLYDCMENSSVIQRKDDDRIRRVPLDLGRPTFENCVIIHNVLATVTVAHTKTSKTDGSTREDQGVENENVNHSSPTATPLVKKDDAIPKEEEILEIPLEAIHLAAKSGNLSAIQDLLAAAEEDDDDEEARTKSDSNDGGGGEGDGDVCAMVNRVAGVDLMTPLHFAAALTTNLSLDQEEQQQSMEAHAGSGDVVVVDAAEVAAECVMELLIRGKANPTKLDARGRPPYFLASHEKVREAFRMARAQLGEDYCKWDEDAKVGPPLTVDDLTARKEKEAEKKKKKKARQKEKKAKEKAQQEEMEKRRQEEQERQKQQEEAKRVRDGLAPKNNAATGNNVCDFCQTVCKGRQRSQMFKRLDYNYCTTECLQKHKRELMAAAALARFNG